MKVTTESAQGTHDHHIHKIILEKRSPYFTALPNFKEGKENHVVLKEVDNVAFEHIVHWLYTDRFSSSFQNNVPIMIRAYAVADRFMMPRCKNMIIDSLKAKFTRWRGQISHLVVVKDLGYSASTIIAACVIDQVVYDALTSKGWSVEQQDEAFFLEGSDLALLLMRRLVEKSRLYTFKADGQGIWKNKGHPDPASEKGCIYHEHAEGEKCYLREAAITAG